ncbi:MAG: o-succinylbenzoate synthase [Candidatus Limnocylindrales bacterium]
MRLERASAVRVRIPLCAPFATATGTWRERDTWIVRLRDAGGRQGVGEASLDPAADDAAQERLGAAIRHWLATGDLSTTTTQHPDPSERSVVAAIEAARLDLGAVALVDGPVSRSVAVNATIATEDRSGSLAAAVGAVERGYATLKLKGGRERSSAELIERLAAIRQAVGPDIALRLDVNGAWDMALARERLDALAPLDLEYVEQPIPAGDSGALARLRDASPVPIAADESVTSLAAARALLAAGAADVLVVKPGRVGGPLVALAIAREAQAAGVGVTISTLLETGVGLTAALRVAACVPGGVHGLATGDVLVSDLLARPLAVQAGRMAVPAGLATSLDEAAVARYAIDRIGEDR